MTEKIFRSVNKKYAEELLETINTLLTIPAPILAVFQGSPYVLSNAELMEAIEENARDSVLYDERGDVEMSHLKAMIAQRMRKLVDHIEAGAGNVTPIKGDAL